MDYKILEYDVQLYFDINPNSHYIIAHKLVYGRHCYAHKKHTICHKQCQFKLSRSFFTLSDLHRFNRISHKKD